MTETRHVRANGSSMYSAAPRRKFWQGDRSLDASRVPHIPERIRRGRRRPAEDPTDPLFQKDLAALADGFGVEDNYEYAQRVVLDHPMMRVLFPPLKDKGDLSPREAEAAALYLWGEELPTMRVLWHLEDYDGMAWAILAEHPPWWRISGWMRPVRGKAKQVSEDNVRQYLRRAARKLNTTVPGLRDLALKGLVRYRNRSRVCDLRLYRRRVRAHLLRPRPLQGPVAKPQVSGGDTTV